MSLLVVVLFAAVFLTVAYFTYGSLLTRLFKLDPQAQDPGSDAARRRGLRADRAEVSAEPAFFGHCGGRADCRADPGRA